MWLLNNESAANVKPADSCDFMWRDVDARKSRSLHPDRWYVLLSYGGAMVLGVLFWIFVIWLCL